MPATPLVQLTTVGVARTKEGLARAELEVQKAMLEEMYGPLRKEVLDIFQTQALGGPRGRIGRNLQAAPIRSFGRPGIQILSTYRDPRTGFNPLRVTRHGHRNRFIYPTRDRARASVRATKGSRERGRRAALRIAPLRQGGKAYFRYRAKGYHPVTDWVQRASRLIEPALDRASENIGRRITSIRL